VVTMIGEGAMTRRATMIEAVAGGLGLGLGF